MNPLYVPKKNDFDGLLTHVIEECSEVIQAACKLRRFGTLQARTNIELADELADLEFAIKRFGRVFPIGLSDKNAENHYLIRKEDEST